MSLFVVWFEFILNKVLAFFCLRKLSQVLMCVILLVSIVPRNHHMMITSIRYWSRVNIQMDTFTTLWSWDPSLFKFPLHFMSIITDCLRIMISVLNFPSPVFSSQIYDITKVLIILTKNCNKKDMKALNINHLVSIFFATYWNPLLKYGNLKLFLFSLFFLLV